VVTLVEESPPVPDDLIMIGPVYNLNTYVGRTLSCPAEFDPPITLAISHQEELPESASSVFIAAYDDKQGFTPLEPPAGYVAKVDEAKAEVSTLSSFVVLAKLAPSPQPARFEVSNLTINPNQAQPGQPIAISLIVTNNGGTAGSYQLQLRIDGVVRAVREITVSPGSSEAVNFEVSDLAAGEHQLEVAGLTSQFSVLSPLLTPAKPPTPATSIPINLPLPGLIITVVVVIGLAAGYLFRLRYHRRAKRLPWHAQR